MPLLPISELGRPRLVMQEKIIHDPTFDRYVIAKTHSLESLELDQSQVSHESVMDC